MTDDMRLGKVDRRLTAAHERIEQLEYERNELISFIKEVAISTSDHTTTDAIDERLKAIAKGEKNG